MRQGIVTFGRDDGGEIFNMTFGHPDPKPGDVRAGDAQRSSVVEFYCFEPDAGFTYEQAHSLLCYRDYARAVVERIYPGLDRDRRLLFARFVAAFVGQDTAVRRDVQRWSERRWRTVTSSDSLIASISRTKHFYAVEQFLRDAVEDMRDAGSTAL